MKKSKSLALNIRLKTLAVTACLIFAMPSLAIPLSTVDSPTDISDQQLGTPEKIANLARPKILIPDGLEANTIIYTPFVFWRAWVQQKLPFVRVVWAMVVALTPLYFLFRKTVLGSIENYQLRWLKSFGIGIGSITFTLMAEATLARMGLFTHLSICLLAFVQFLALLGLTVAAQSVGLSVLRQLGLSERPSNPVARAILTLWLGILLISLLVLLPRIWVLQELGNRMIALIAATGAGAIISRLYALKSGAEIPN